VKTVWVIRALVDCVDVWHAGALWVLGCRGILWKSTSGQV